MTARALAAQSPGGYIGLIGGEGANLLEGYEHVAAAHAALCQEGISPRQRLVQAAAEFWKALPYAETWPEPVRQRCAATAVRLFRRGSIDATIRHMNDARVALMLVRLEEFTDSFLRGEA